MDTDAFIEKLAFGKSTPKMNSCIGLYISPETIYVSEVRMDKGRPVVDHLVRVPLPVAAEAATTPGTPPSTLNTDFLADPTKVATVVRQTMSQIRWNSKNVVVTLSHHLGLLRYFVMPQVEKKFWPTSVPMEAKKYIPIPFDALVHDFQVLPMTAGGDGKPRQGALIAVTPRKNMPNIEGLIKNLDLTPMGIEAAPCSATRLLHVLGGGRSLDAYSQVHFDGGNIRILICDKGLPVFFREVFLGANSTPDDSRKVDIGGCLGFTMKQLGVAKPSELRISGASSELDAWKETLSRDSGLPAVSLDIAARLGIKGGDWGGFASIGAALKYLAPAPITIDMSGVGRISDVEKRSAKTIFILSAILTIALSVYGFYLNIVYGVKAREFKKLKPSPEMEEVVKGMTGEQIEKVLSTMQDHADQLSGLDSTTKVRSSDILKDLTSALPEKTWLSRISVLMPLKGGSSRRELQISGGAVGTSIVEEQDLAFLYRDNLIKTPVVGQAFPDLQVTVSVKTLPNEQLMSLTQDALKKTLEGRTEFRIIGKMKSLRQ